MDYYGPNKNVIAGELGVKELMSQRCLQKKDILDAKMSSGRSAIITIYYYMVRVNITYNPSA